MFSNARQHIPKVFKYIAENHEQISAMKVAPIVDFKESKRLLEVGRGLRREAEVLLRWNTDKGNGASG